MLFVNNLTYLTTRERSVVLMNLENSL